MWSFSSQNIALPSTETNKDKYGIVVVDNMLGKNLTFKNVGLRYGHGHFVFIEPKFFSKKSKNRSELCFKNSWEDVHPLLSKSSKTNLSLSYPYQYKKFDYLNATEHSDVHSLMVVADFSLLSGVNEIFSGIVEVFFATAAAITKCNFPALRSQ